MLILDLLTWASKHSGNSTGQSGQHVWRMCKGRGCVIGEQRTAEQSHGSEQE